MSQEIPKLKNVYHQEAAAWHGQMSDARARGSKRAEAFANFDHGLTLTTMMVAGLAQTMLGLGHKDNATFMRDAATVTGMRRDIRSIKTGMEMFGTLGFLSLPAVVIFTDYGWEAIGLVSGYTGLKIFLNHRQA